MEVHRFIDLGDIIIRPNFLVGIILKIHIISSTIRRLIDGSKDIYIPVMSNCFQKTWVEQNIIRTLPKNIITEK